MHLPVLDYKVCDKNDFFNEGKEMLQTIGIPTCHIYACVQQNLSHLEPLGGKTVLIFSELSLSSEGLSKLYPLFHYLLKQSMLGMC